jgi:hypothetical protein
MFRRRLKSLDEKDVAADPGRLELLWLLRRDLDDALVEEMAASDGGMCKEEYREALAEILRTGAVPPPLLLASAEICNLLMWGAVQLDTPFTLEQRRDQVMCLFASWILINAYTRPERARDGSIEQGDELALQNLTELSMELGPEFVRASIRFVLWAQSEGAAAHDPMDNLFYLLSLLVLRCASPDPEEVAAAPAVYDVLVAGEQQLRRQMCEDESAGRPPERAWLFGLYNGSCDGVVKSDSIQRRWVRTAVWALDRLEASGSGRLDSRLAAFRVALLKRSLYLTGPK